MSAMSPVVGLFEAVARVPQMATLCTWSCTPNWPANLSLCREYATQSDKNDRNNKHSSSARQKSANKSKSPDPVFDEFHNIHFESKSKSTPPSSSSTTFKRHPSTFKFNDISNKNNNTKSNDNKSSNNNKSSSSNTSNRHASGSTQSASSSCSSGSKKKFNPRHRKTPWDMTPEEFIVKNSYAYADYRENEEMVKAYFSQKRRRANRQKTNKKTMEEDDSDDEDPFTTSYSRGGASSGNANARNFPGSKSEFHPDFSDWFENYNSSYEGGRDHSSSSSSSYKRSKGSWEEEAYRSKYQEQMSLDELLRSFRSKSMNWDSFKTQDDQESFNNSYHNFDPQKLYERFYSKANRGSGAAGGSANGYSSQNFKYNHYNSSFGSNFPSATPADVVSNLSVLGLTPQGGTHISADKTGEPAPSWSHMDEAFLKRAFRVRALEWHPDRHTCPSGKAKAEERFKEMQVAYEALRVKLQARG
eukprot:CAMPEP_0175056712 /NCGR_PEP_ID=MMETSP0052_2-20121109/10837_1 /TAXON_ID=51329 ORGANISM="Polytomella parva, Strain SAG 63-3" /NCGR_SAMPLE_ID=MMETSP0052_2 /ASSEMBLY_ACC=CAM_ASM_000194 /LENGTH=472 /DNA_ID=CAMNT_0016321797 /DNA_START=151 /DNA_END=1569 /DNA_ORIENTATION=+